MTDITNVPEVPFPLSIVKPDSSSLTDTEIPFPFMSEDKEVQFPLSVKTIPETVKDLIGRRCRVIKLGDHITFDYSPTRVNIILDERSYIKDIRLG